MTFCWKGWSKRYLPRHWQKYMELIRQLNKYFEKHDIDIKYSILKYPSIKYIIKIDSALECYIAEKGYKCHRKGKHELSKLCDELKTKALVSL